MDVSDVERIVEVHCITFPDSLLTHLGRPYLRHYYAQYFKHPQHYAVVAEIDGRIVGFITGTACPDDLNSRVYRPPLGTAFQSALRIFTDPVLRRHLALKPPHVARVFRAFAGRRVRTRSFQSSAKARLLSMGVLPEVRGRRIAESLLRGISDRLCADGQSLIGSSVIKSNTSALTLYDRIGWHREFEDEYGVYFTRPTQAV
ncbi:MAG: GNAT family N-acetyltransferase [Candidatus Eremiobacteraeota bacterium]|nr:GNAT family N-acetyltransferase [Candidatus Eremiobacteraeota bacterium]